MKIDMVSPENMRDRSSMLAVVVTVASLLVVLFAAPVQAVIVFTGASSGANNGLPTDTTAGPLTINIPAGTVAGQALIATIAARPSGMTVTVPANWFAMTVTQQPTGGPSTLPGGMTLLTYYHIVGIAEPASYTWTFANTAGSGASYGGSAVGGLLAFSGIDTSGGNPINVWSALNVNGAPHTTTSITPTVTNTMIVSSISYLSGSSFANPTSSAGCIVGITERLDQRAPVAVADIGTTLQMSTATCATATASGAVTAVIQPVGGVGADDSGVGHLMALKPAAIDPAITMTRSGPLIPGSPASYTLSVSNLGISAEPGPLTVVDTLPAGLTYNAAGSGGTGWVCGAVGQVVTCTRAGALAGGASAAALLLNVNVAAGTSGTKTNTATVSGTGGDGNTANNTATDSFTIAVDLVLSMTRVGTIDPGTNASYTLAVNNAGTQTEPGAITITDTLQAGLTFVSGTGTGWACSAAGQTVTCTRAGTLIGGATTATLTLTVAVASTVSAVTQTATVAGTGGDSNAANNTASDTYNVSADLSLVKARGAALVPGTNATYTLTVTNSGPNVSPQPIIITDTLPANLTFVSGTGTGWACSAAGQVVTCTRNTTLAVGATSPVTLTVAVSLGATGTTISNTATVSGPAVDGTPANNSSTDSFTIPLATYAYYKMDETSWGVVTDSSGNGRDAAKLGTAAPTGFPPPATPGSAIAGNPGTCGAGTIPLGTGAASPNQMGVNTPVNPNALGNAGTISFWYQSNAAWTSAGNTNDRTLLDATGGSNTSEFWLVLQQAGSLRFVLDNAGGAAQTLTGTVRAFGANTWHHIAITWDFTAHTMFIYVDGVQDATRNNVAVTSAPNYATVVVGDSKTTVFTTPNRGNSANGYLDEVRVYAAALTGTQVQADMNATHACSVAGPNHYELSLPTSSIACLASTATVTACADATSPCTNKYAAASGTTAILGTSAGTLGATTVTFDATGVATTTLSFPAAADGAAATLTLSGEALAATSPRQCCPNGVSCAAANSCSTTFNTAGFIFAAAAGGAVASIPTQVAGTSSGTFVLRAVKSSTTTQACEAALTGAQTVNLAYECNNPQTCSGSNLMNVPGNVIAPIARNNNGTVSASTGSFTGVTLNFDAAGNANVTFNYLDVGKVTLWAKKAAGGSLLTALSGASTPFVVRPATFVLSNIKQTASPFNLNPGAVDATGGKFVRAGEAFSATVTAMTSGALVSAAATPNYGNEDAPAETVDLASALVAPAGGASGALSGGFGTFSGGVATGTAFTFSEVGIISLTPSRNYLGAGTTTGTAITNVGRFIPDHFIVAAIPPTNRFNASCASNPGFTYMGETLRATFTLTAVSALAGNPNTLNYTGAFAKFDGSVFNNFGFAGVDLADATVPLGATAFPTGSLGGISSGGWGVGTGVGSFTADIAISRTLAPTTPPGPFESFQLGAIPVDTDGVAPGTLDLDTDVPPNTNDRANVGATKIRYGRLFIPNTYGTEKLNLTVPVEAQYWNGTFWQRNTDDSCTSMATASLAIGYPTSGIPLTAANLPQANATMLSAAGTPVASTTMASGTAKIQVTPPAGGAKGSARLAIKLGTGTGAPVECSWNAGGNPNPTGPAAAETYLWVQDPACSTNFDKDPISRITFGVTPSRFIYNRENY